MRTVVDIFCGAGGLSYGFEAAGFKLAGALDFDSIAAELYSAQHPDVPFLNSDVAKVTGEDVRSLVSGRAIDVMIGGPSCQGFSTHGKRDPYDERNFLFKHFVRLVGRIQPPWVVMENVKGLLTYDHGRYRDEIHASFRRVGYAIESRVLNAADYGVPQLRERLFFIATNTGGDIRFPTPTHCPAEQCLLSGLLPHVGVWEAIGDLPSIGCEGEADWYLMPPKTPFQRYARAGAGGSVTLHRAKPVSPLAMSIISRIPPGKGVRHLAESQLPERFRKMRTVSNGALRRDCTTLYYRLRWDRPAYTITCYFNNVSSGPFVHPSENRSLTPREAARLQSFRDSYRFASKQLGRQIGNAVPPLLARAVAEAVLGCLTESSHRREEVFV